MTVRRRRPGGRWTTRASRASRSRPSPPRARPGCGSSPRRSPLDEAKDVTASLAELTGSEVDDVNLTSVGPSWGAEISEKALRALVFFLVALTLYITFRFELKMAIPTIVALVHDILVTIGVYSLAGFEVTPATVVALLTILGFSIYDGIVVFDKVDENTQLVGTSQQPHLQRHGQPVAQPGAHAVVEHVDHGPAAGGLAAHPRLLRAGRHHPAGVRPRPARSGLSPAPTRRSSSPRRSSPCSRSASRVPGHPPQLGGGDRGPCRPPVAVDARAADDGADPPSARRRRCRAARSRRARARRARSAEPAVRSLVGWSSEASWLRAHLRDIPDFPKPGVTFKDITPLLTDGTPSGSPSTPSPTRGPGAESIRSPASRRAGSCWRRPSPTASARAASRSASPASCRGRWSSSPTSSSTAWTRCRPTATRPRPATGCWWWTTCWPRAARPRPPARCSRAWAPRWSGSTCSWSWGSSHGRATLGERDVRSLLVEA